MHFRKFQILTITHQNLSVEELKHFVIPSDNKDQLVMKLDQLKQDFAIEELIYLNTCNRVSFIMVLDTHIDKAWTKSFLSAVNPSLPEVVVDKLPKFIDVLSGLDALKHLYQVASSVDSLVVGEREIFRQFREAYAFSKEYNLSGDFLRMVEQSTVNTAKYIYTHTKIGERPVSVASLVFKKVLQSSLDKDSKILLIGAGDTNRNIARFLGKHKFSQVTVFNRSLSNTGEIADLLDCEPLHLSDLKSYDGGFDGIIICTGSTQAIIDLPTYRSLLQKDTSHKVLVDLSVPRNISSEVVDQYDCDYIDIESIRSLAEENMSFRKQEVIQAQVIIQEKAEEFESVLQMRRLEKALSDVPQEIKAVKQRAITQVFKEDIDSLDAKSKEVLLQMMDYMEKKCIAVPMKVAKAHVAE